MGLVLTELLAMRSGGCVLSENRWRVSIVLAVVVVEETTGDGLISETAGAVSWWMGRVAQASQRLS